MSEFLFENSEKIFAVATWKMIRNDKIAEELIKYLDEDKILSYLLSYKTQQHFYDAIRKFFEELKEMGED